MNRENKSTVTVLTDRAIYGGYDVAFIYEIAQGETKPVKVIATAKKIGNNNGMPLMPPEEIEIIGIANETKVKCPAGTPKELIDAIETECKTILEVN